LLYTKDQQLLNLEHKLKHAKEELNKIINTKVFSRGNNLIYELDMSTRQLRLLKDNVFSLEKGLKEKIRLHFDKDLTQTRVLLDEQKRKFSAYQDTLNSHMRARVTEEVNYIEQTMRKRVDVFKNVHSAEDALDGGKGLGSSLSS
jgi:predicted deacetylase